MLNYNAYNKLHPDEPADIYKKNANLKCVVQSVIYSSYEYQKEGDTKLKLVTGYIHSTSKYSKDNAKTFYHGYFDKYRNPSQHIHEFSHDDFANKVMERYAAVKANGVNIVVG